MKIEIGKSESSKAFTVPVDMVTQTAAIVGIRGSGKTNTAVVMAEGLLEAGQQVAIIDPLDVWWGLRSSADGKGDGYPVVIIGGEHADIPLEPGAGKAVADFVTDHRASVVISTRHLSKTKQRSFVADFAEHLYDRKGKAEFKTPMQLIIDEADAFAPQRVEGDSARSFGAIDDLVRRGRSSGFGVTCISQRPAVLNKDILTQVEMLIVHRILSPQDRKAIEAWVEVHDAEGVADKVLGSLHLLKRGEAWIWSPSWLGVLDRVGIRVRQTFDSSYTPKIGEAKAAPKKVAAVDLDSLKKAMGETLERAKANDPAELKRRIAALEKQLKSVPAKTVERPVEKIVEKLVIRPAEVTRLEKLADKFDAAAEKHHALGEKAETASTQIQAVLKAFTDSQAAPKPVPARPMHAPLRMPPNRQPMIQKATAADDGSIAAGTSDGIGKSGKRRILIALAQECPNALAKRKLSIKTGISQNGGTWRIYLADLRRLGYVSGTDSIAITPEGLAALGEFHPLPTGHALIEYWRRELGDSGKRRLFDALVGVYPSTMTAADLEQATGIARTGGTWRIYMGELRGLELVTGRGDELKAADELFE